MSVSVVSINKSPTCGHAVVVINCDGVQETLHLHADSMEIDSLRDIIALANGNEDKLFLFLAVRRARRRGISWATIIGRLVD